MTNSKIRNHNWCGHKSVKHVQALNSQVRNHDWYGDKSS